MAYRKYSYGKRRYPLAPLAKQYRYFTPGGQRKYAPSSGTRRYSRYKTSGNSYSRVRAGKFRAVNSRGLKASDSVEEVEISSRIQDQPLSVEWIGNATPYIRCTCLTSSGVVSKTRSGDTGGSWKRSLSRLGVSFAGVKERVYLETTSTLPLVHRRILIGSRSQISSSKIEFDDNIDRHVRNGLVPASSQRGVEWGNLLFAGIDPNSWTVADISGAGVDVIYDHSFVYNNGATNGSGVIREKDFETRLYRKKIRYDTLDIDEAAENSEDEGVFASERSLYPNIYALDIFRLGMGDISGSVLVQPIPKSPKGKEVKMEGDGEGGSHGGSLPSHDTVRLQGSLSIFFWKPRDLL